MSHRDELPKALADAMRENFSPEAIAAMIAYLQAVETRSDEANSQVSWFADALMEMLGVDAYNRMANELGL